MDIRIYRFISLAKKDKIISKSSCFEYDLILNTVNLDQKKYHYGV